ncbi:MAG TPA: HU family DNA-binding protein [Candidatus Competibacteraceae bacterium]|nr:MAG: HU family DNA-binding protein [Candidatus Competibacteraceae bacterium]HQC72989.1 HU family DNA-binding protein [Candidatus Competibacteraceae bacterium]
MNKTELVDAVAQAADLPKTTAGKAVDALLLVIGEALKSGDSVVLPRFGTFSVRERAARAGRNPKTQETMEIKASKIPVFKAGKTLKDMIKS